MLPKFPFEHFVHMHRNIFPLYFEQQSSQLMKDAIITVASPVTRSTRGLKRAIKDRVRLQGDRPISTEAMS